MQQINDSKIELNYHFLPNSYLIETKLLWNSMRNL